MTGNYWCVCCGGSVSDSMKDWCLRHGKVSLCYPCQKKKKICCENQEAKVERHLFLNSILRLYDSLQSFPL